MGSRFGLDRALLSALLLLLPLAAAANASTLNVPADYPTIQAAIVAAQPGDVVLVAPGTYLETIDFLGKGITVQSSGGAAVTTIDANGGGSVVSFVSGEPTGTTLRGFKITGGTGSAFSYSTMNWSVGGGVKIVGSHATIDHCTISDNVAVDRGGGIFVHNASGSAALTLTDCIVHDNQAAAFPSALGAGLYSFGGNVTLSVCEFYNNVSNGSGGGFAVQAEPSALGGFSATECTLIFNSAALDGGGGWALLTSGPTTLELVRCEVAANGAQTGGGLAATAFAESAFGQAVVKLTRTHLHENTAVQAAAASLYASSFGQATVSSCMIWGNQADPGGASLVATGPVNLRGDTIVSNTGGGLRLTQAQGLVDSCLIWGNEGGSILHDAPVPDPIWCDIEGGFPGTGNIDIEPVFNCLACDDYHLAPTAACVDAGNPDWVAAGELDVDGDPRVQFGRVDIGADEADFASGPWTFLGHALASPAGAPSLSGMGALTSGSTTTLTISDVPSNCPLWIIAGTDQLLLPFKGGVMVPTIGQLLGPFITSGVDIELMSAWPALPSGFVVYLQVWIGNSHGPAGFTATNGLAAKTQ